MTRADFDSGYATVERSPRRAALFAEALGLPAEIEPNSFLTVPVLELLASYLPVGGHLLDVACGRGGIGLWFAERLGASLFGVDFSRVAVASASRRGPGRWWVADQAALGLGPASVDGAVSIDAMQFSADRLAVVREAYRVLRPGGRYVLTNWEPRDPGHPDVPAGMRELDVRALLGAAGFRVLRYEERRDLAERQEAVFAGALALDAEGDEALLRLQREARHVAPWSRVMRRVLAVADRA